MKSAHTSHTIKKRSPAPSPGRIDKKARDERAYLDERAEPYGTKGKRTLRNPCDIRASNLAHVHDLLGGFCRQKHSHRNTDSRIGPGGQETRAETQGKRPTKTENPQKLRDPAPT